jgi:hypothetical protein
LVSAQLNERASSLGFGQAFTAPVRIQVCAIRGHMQAYFGAVSESIEYIRVGCCP